MNDSSHILVMRKLNFKRDRFYIAFQREISLEKQQAIS